MDNWILKGIKTLVNEPASVNITSPTQVKVKVSHVLLTAHDALLYNGGIETAYPTIPGRTAVGIVTEAGEKCRGISKGTRVYLEPTRPCGKCLACKTGKFNACKEVMAAGKDFDGFLRDFVVCENDEVKPLPKRVDDFKGLCIESVGIAENIYDKLHLSAGHKVAVVGAGFSGSIIAQVLAYHKVVPIVIDNVPANLERAKKCGIFYAFEANDDLLEHIESATIGNLCDAAVYSADSRLPISLTSRLVADGKSVVLSAITSANTAIEVNDILKKNLTVFGVSSAYGYTDKAISLLEHNAVYAEFFEKQILTDFDPSALLEEMSETSGTSKMGKMTVLKMII